jgi:hypothetical protein
LHVFWGQLPLLSGLKHLGRAALQKKVEDSDEQSDVFTNVMDANEWNTTELPDLDEARHAPLLLPLPSALAHSPPTTSFSRESS